MYAAVAAVPVCVALPVYPVFIVALNTHWLLLLTLDALHALVPVPAVPLHNVHVGVRVPLPAVNTYLPLALVLYVQVVPCAVNEQLQLPALQS